MPCARTTAPVRSVCRGGNTRTTAAKGWLRADALTAAQPARPSIVFSLLEVEIDAALTRADALRQAILKKAFSGQLVPRDPDDEPAAMLLACIKANRAKAPKTTRNRKARA